MFDWLAAVKLERFYLMYPLRLQTDVEGGVGNKPRNEYIFVDPRSIVRKAKENADYFPKSSSSSGFRTNVPMSQ